MAKKLLKRMLQKKNIIKNLTGMKYLSVFSPNAGKCGKNADQNNSEYGHFLHSDCGSAESQNKFIMGYSHIY